MLSTFSYQFWILLWINQSLCSRSDECYTIGDFPPNMPDIVLLRLYCRQTHHITYLLLSSSYVATLPFWSTAPYRPPVPPALHNQSSRALLSGPSGVCVPIGGTLLPLWSGDGPPLSWATNFTVWAPKISTTVYVPVPSRWIFSLRGTKFVLFGSAVFRSRQVLCVIYSE